MTDIEMTKLCALAMGWKHLGAVGVEPPKRGEPDPKGLWCMSGGNDWWMNPDGYNVCAPCSGIPDPLQDSAHALALVKRLGLTIDPQEDVAPFTWRVVVALYGDWNKQIYSEGQDLNRAIVECAAKLWTEQRGGDTSV